jgi:periplasmic divalent cation tolerance protein
VSEARVVLSTCPDAQAAETVARALVDERLAACVNLVPGVRSIYRWHDAVEVADEILLVIKTTAPNVDALTARIAQLHPYEVPEVIALEATDVSDAYLAWLEGSVS